MTDKEKYEALVNTIIDQCIEMDLKKKEAMRRENLDAAGEYLNKYSALLKLIKSQGDEIFLLLKFCLFTYPFSSLKLIVILSSRI